MASIKSTRRNNSNLSKSFYTHIHGYLNSLLNLNVQYPGVAEGRSWRSCRCNDILSRVSGASRTTFSTIAAIFARNWFPIILKVEVEAPHSHEKMKRGSVRAFVDDGETHTRLDNEPLARRDHFIFNFFATCSFEIRKLCSS